MSTCVKREQFQVMSDELKTAKCRTQAARAHLARGQALKDTVSFLIPRVVSRALGRQTVMGSNTEFIVTIQFLDLDNLVF